MPCNDLLLEIENLQTCFLGESGRGAAVDNVSLTVREGETVAIVGESGCGKSTLALSVMRLVPAPGSIRSGSIRLGGRELTAAGERDMRRIRGREMALIFQDAMNAFHPCMKLGAQLAEALRDGTRRSRRERVAKMLEFAGLPDPQRIMSSYSFELSGGMLQRVMIAMALLNRPRLVIADEPTTALDVTVQAHILQLFKKMKAAFGMGMLFISHDLGVVAEVADRVAVMRYGRLVELGTMGDVYERPAHEYTRQLLHATPRLGEPLPGANAAGFAGRMAARAAERPIPVLSGKAGD
jgi:ABC-type dipeptide/oligopeptide/nickel transport system ATPase component